MAQIAKRKKLVHIIIPKRCLLGVAGHDNAFSNEHDISNDIFRRKNGVMSSEGSSNVN